MRDTQNRARELPGSGELAFLMVVFVLVLLLALAPPVSACTTIIVGKRASATGCCLLAHNENDPPEFAQIVKKVPAARHAAGSVYRLLFGGAVRLPARTQGFVATAIYDKELCPGDYTGVINDHQVSIFNNYALGKYEPEEDEGALWTEFTELAALKAKTARQAVRIIGRLVETYGNAWGGTMFGVADPDEAWWIEIFDRQWVAQRVPDNAAEMRANCYRIGVVSFDQPSQFMYSPGIRTFAIAQGWYKPADGPFDWTKVYAEDGSTVDEDNVIRHEMVAQYLAEDLARGRIDKQDLMDILRSHFEGSQYWNLHNHPYTPCNGGAIASSVAELRGWLPAGIGGVLWTALSAPCSNGYVPWYEGIKRVPTEYEIASSTPDPSSAYWACRSLRRWAMADYDVRHPTVARAWQAFEQREFANQARVEARALRKYWMSSPGRAWACLTHYSGARAHKAYLGAQQLQR